MGAAHGARQGGPFIPKEAGGGGLGACILRCEAIGSARRGPGSQELPGMQTWAWGVCRPPTGFASHLLLLLRGHCWAQKGHRNREALGSRSVDSASFDTHAEVGAGGSPVSFSLHPGFRTKWSSTMCFVSKENREEGKRKKFQENILKQSSICFPQSYKKSEENYS